MMVSENILKNRKGADEMASSKEYLGYVLDLLSGLDEVSFKQMMGEYILYYRGKIIGGVYDDRFLLKPVKAVKERMPDAELEAPYEGAKEMVLVDTEDRGILEELLEEMYAELPEPEKRRNKPKITEQVDQYVMAYRGDHELIKALLPGEFSSLRPVLRINAEIRRQGDREGYYIEFNTPVEGSGKRGWFNIKCFDSADTDISVAKTDAFTEFRCAELAIRYIPTGKQGGCPAENDNDGCFYGHDKYLFVPAEVISENKEYCGCEFEWLDSGVSQNGRNAGNKRFLSAAAIPCEEILGAYKVEFTRIGK